MKAKDIKISIANAEAGQLLSLRCELNLLSKQWRPYGPIIKVDGKLPDSNNNSLRLQGSSNKRIGKKWVKNLSRWG
jgi:hypothetical protein